MPLINGMKMACEPCIRGHRSTKCTHANERLMVPVKKPGRPLSACPHLHNQLCGCSSVTAAIPRKQKCYCGTGESAGPPLTVQPRPLPSAIPDIPSPTKVAFRVQKPSLSSRPSNGKQSYDLNNLERMDASNVNITTYQTSSRRPAPGEVIPKGHSNISLGGSYMDGSQRPRSSAGTQNQLLRSQYADVSFLPKHSNGEYLAGFPISDRTIFDTDASYLQLSTKEDNLLKDFETIVGASCCEVKPDTINIKMTFEPHSYETPNYEDNSESSDVSLMSSGVTPETAVANGHSDGQNYLFANDFSSTPDVYSSLIPQPTIYEYPASYGSYQHPIQPSQWRKDFRSNMYAQPILEPEMMNGHAIFTSELLSDQKTRHSCCCGDACQCIGCAAHPYNSATRNCVRSAYIVSQEPLTSTKSEFSNDQIDDMSFKSSSDAHVNGNDHLHKSDEEPLPPHGDTSSESSPVEEQTLSALDYIFVNYPFVSDGCGGDTNSCPCGDECECIGCTIHRFDDSSLGFPTDFWTNEEMFTDGNGEGLSTGNFIKQENLLDDLSDKPKKSCCG